jgi:hypothetical protein
MADTEHALFSASKAPRWVRCPGSIALEATVEKTSSRYADEGTAAHTLASLCLEQGQPAIAFAGRLIDAGDRKFEVDEDMLENVQLYVDYCNALRSVGDLSFVEQRVDFSADIGQPNSFGTSDFLCLIGDELVVVDLKYGMGVRVDADENEQLMLYALGALNELALVADIKTVRLVIHQPRMNHLSEWPCTVADLRRFADIAKGRAYQAALQNAADFLAPGEKQCKFCPAKAVCPALAADILRTIAPVAAASDAGFDDLTAETMPQAAGLSNEVIASILPKLDLIGDWCDAIKARAHRELLNRREVPGYKLVAGKRGNRAWSNEAEAEAAMKSMRLKQDEMYDFKLISPTTAEKRLKDAPRRWNKLSGLITQKDGAPTLAPISDSRPALLIGDPADDFQPVAKGLDLV